MKKMIVLGLCLATSVSVFSVKNTNSNESNLGVATVVMNNNKMIAFEDTEASASVAAAAVRAAVKVWNRSCKVVAYQAVYEVANWLGTGSAEVDSSVASIELQDEMNSKFKKL